MESRQCACCGQAFRPHSQVPQQMYCSSAACQRERRRLWQQAKRASDADYRENQARAQRGWAQNHCDYWREYRRRHPQYCQSNRDAARQRQRERRERAAPAEHAKFAKMDASTPVCGLPSGSYGLPPAEFAKMDASTPVCGLPSGTYRLIPAVAEFAKMDAWMVEITLVSMPYGREGEVCKERT
jgi:hypothetical protein